MFSVPPAGGLFHLPHVIISGLEGVKKSGTVTSGVVEGT